MNTVKQNIVSWFVLVLLTILSVFLSDFTSHYVLFIVLALLIVFIKGQQVTDVFMELKSAPTMWRLLLLSYVFLIPCIISLIYIL
jgi:hypothetical protein